MREAKQNISVGIRRYNEFSQISLDLESPRNDTLFRDRVNIRSSVNQSLTKPATPKRRPLNENTNTNAKKFKTTNDDSWSSNLVPIVEREPLDFFVRQIKNNEHAQIDENALDQCKFELDNSQASPQNATNKSIEVQSFADETHVVNSTMS